MTNCVYDGCDKPAHHAYEFGGTGPRFRVHACLEHLLYAVSFVPLLPVIDLASGKEMDEVWLQIVLATARLQDRQKKLERELSGDETSYSGGSALKPKL